MPRHWLQAIFMAMLSLVVLQVQGFGKADPETYAAYLKAEKDIYFLNTLNFENLIGTGTWVVFYGHKECPHCQR
jgi:hypothetical protein